MTPLSQIEDAMISIINDNENKGKITYLGELGSRLNDRFTDFDVRNYGYTKLMVFLKDTCPRLFLYQLDSAWAVGLNDQLDREKLEQEIRVFIQKNGGQVDNLSLIYEEIHKKHSSFDTRIMVTAAVPASCAAPFSFGQRQQRQYPGEKIAANIRKIKQLEKALDKMNFVGVR